MTTRHLFFIDSYTHHESVALQIAHEAGVDAMKRDVFLDPDRSPETVAREFERMKILATTTRTGSRYWPSLPGDARAA